MKKEKGFTLIELLAVIIILAIIALISVPLVLNIIEKAKKSAFKDSAYGIIESAKLYYVENIIDNKELGDKVFSYEEEEKELNYSGTKPKGGTVILKINGKIEMVIHNGKWCAIKVEEEQQVKIIDYNKETCKIDSPIISEGTSLEYMKLGLDSPIPGSYYNIKNQKGTVTCINLSNENKEVTNTSELKEGDNNIKCSMNYENKEITSLTRTFKVDGTVPTITSNYTETAYTMIEKTSVAVSTLYTVTYGGMGGNITCKNGNTEITNLNTLAVGSHTLTCTATGNNEKSASVNPQVTVKPDEISGNELVKNNPDIATEDSDENPRFVGSNPKNYVNFNGKLFRIIGIFNGQMKIMQNDFYSEGIVWNTNENNDWARPADLNTELNTTYWNTIDSLYQNMVDESHSWGIGGIDESNSTRSNFYNEEKNRMWKGKVGLMSIADYGYASSYSNCTDSSKLNYGYNCFNNNWIYSSSIRQWTITRYGGDYKKVWNVIPYDGGFIFYSSSSISVAARPVLFLKPEVKITNAKEENAGTSSNPYQLSI